MPPAVVVTSPCDDLELSPLEWKLGQDLDKEAEKQAIVSPHCNGDTIHVISDDRTKRLVTRFYIGYAIVSTLFFLPLGVVGLILAWRARKFSLAGNIRAARRTAKYSLWLSTAALLISAALLVSWSIINFAKMDTMQSRVEDDALVHRPLEEHPDTFDIAAEKDAGDLALGENADPGIIETVRRQMAGDLRRQSRNRPFNMVKT